MNDQLSVRIYHPRFVPVDRQPQPPFEQRFHRRDQLLALRAWQDHEVVRITHPLRRGPVLRAGRRLQTLVKPV